MNGVTINGANHLYNVYEIKTGQYNNHYSTVYGWTGQNVNPKRREGSSGFIYDLGLNKDKVERAGFEPTTSGLTRRRSTNWAIQPYDGSLSIGLPCGLLFQKKKP